MDAEVIVVDFRRSGSVQAALLRARSAFAPQMIEMAFNSCCEAEVAIVVRDDGEGGDVTSNYGLAKKLSRVTERPVVYVDNPETIERWSMRQLGVPAALITALIGAR